MPKPTAATAKPPPNPFPVGIAAGRKLNELQQQRAVAFDAVATALVADVARQFTAVLESPTTDRVTHDAAAKRYTIDVLLDVGFDAASTELEVLQDLLPAGQHDGSKSALRERVAADVKTALQQQDYIDVVATLAPQPPVREWVGTARQHVEVEQPPKLHVVASFVDGA